MSIHNICFFLCEKKSINDFAQAFLLSTHMFSQGNKEYMYREIRNTCIRIHPLLWRYVNQ